MAVIESWGHYPPVFGSKWQYFKGFIPKEHSVLPFGLGRSYGDVCLNTRGTHLVTSTLDSILNLDVENGFLTVQAGVSIKRILSFLSRRNLFLPVVPGTQYVTVGGAIANDIHGKSHHREGSFGNNVSEITLLRSNGEIHNLTNKDGLFRATVGGLGLTGLILSAKLRVIKIPGKTIQQKITNVYGLNEITQGLIEESAAWPYTVAWLDFSRDTIRGILISGAFSDRNSRDPNIKIKFPFQIKIVNKWTINALNLFYYWVKRMRTGNSFIHYQNFFFPLDSIQGWNNAYGKWGLMQWQAVFPKEPKIIECVYKLIREFNEVPSLVVLKDFGDITPNGLLSFPKKGFTLAIDFAVNLNTIRLVDRLNEFIADVGGRIYLAKDSRLKTKTFSKMFNMLDEFIKYKDPYFESDLWRRLVN